MIIVNLVKKYVVWLVILVVIVGISSIILNTFRSSNKIETINAEVNALRQVRDNLQAQLSLQNTPEYIEKIARNKLNLIKPGENVYFVIDDNNDSGEVSGINTTILLQPSQQWIQLILNGLRN